PQVAIVNETFARHFWPNQDPIGKRFRMTSAKTPLMEVVGVARNGKYLMIWEEPLPYFYIPVAQHYQSMGYLQLRTSVPPESLKTRLAKEVQGLDPAMPLNDFQPMTEALGGLQGFMAFRIGAIQTAILGALGLMLALVGVYGVASYGAAQR